MLDAYEDDKDFRGAFFSKFRYVTTCISIREEKKKELNTTHYTLNLSKLRECWKKCSFSRKSNKKNEINSTCQTFGHEIEMFRKLWYLNTTNLQRCTRHLANYNVGKRLDIFVVNCLPTCLTIVLVAFANTSLKTLVGRVSQ